ncbi:tetratricopeptide repeat protein [Sporosarcina aquimarina]|uniref:Tetratricopeptide repeat protein n=1 Tax=Sporosarcina aquimarina TaxID=114975 RepID=A0ABU4FY71_9BACL|nr:tetratricopeptide repeat protein [Sporosarcina aquimarina]MDW0109671.1 tetratricopeptide repeat protein [Sporosarcina aquimarina]
MKRKRERLHKKGNMIAFPGTVERLLDRAEDASQAEEFEEAVRLCEQLLEISPDLPEIPGLLAISLYELKEFEQAKPYAAQWLQGGMSDYFEAMELYLAICMQLQEYEEVEDTIGAILDEGVVPSNLKQKFLYLRELNGRLSNRFTEEPIQPVKTTMSFEEFLKLDRYQQQEILSHLENNGAEQSTELLVKIATYDSFPPVLRTVAVVLLRSTGHAEPLVIRKFGRGLSVIPAELPLPGEDPTTKKVCALLQETFDKDPSRLSLLEEAVKKFSVISYPLDWGTPAETVAVAYENYSSYLFEGTPLPQTALHQLIFAVDQDVSEAAE